MAEELAANLERIADLKARVNMLECEREREKYAALEAAKAYDRNDEMMQRVHNLEMALQQAHEDYKILSKGKLENYVIMCLYLKWCYPKNGWAGYLW